MNKILYLVTAPNDIYDGIKIAMAKKTVYSFTVTDGIEPYFVIIDGYNLTASIVSGSGDVIRTRSLRRTMTILDRCHYVGERTMFSLKFETPYQKNDDIWTFYADGRNMIHKNQYEGDKMPRISIADNGSVIA